MLLYVLTQLKFILSALSLTLLNPIQLTWYSIFDALNQIYKVQAKLKLWLYIPRATNAMHSVHLV